MSPTRHVPPTPPVFPCFPNTARWTSPCGAGSDCVAQVRRASPLGAGRSPRGGFTLIELLAGIAIIGILGVLLVPTINGGRDSASSVKCIANLHQIGVMTEIYCSDSGNILPPNNSWTCRGSSYLELLVAQVKGVSVYDARDAIARGEVPSHCPVVLPGDRGITLKSPNDSSYWINYGVNYVNLGGLMTADGPPAFSRFNVKHPSKCIYLADGQMTLLNSAWSAAQPAARHHGKSNVLWIDGHVTSELQSWLVDPANYVEYWWSQ